MAFIPVALAAVGAAAGTATAAVGGIGTAIGIGSSILGAAGALASGEAAKQSADYNAAVAKTTAQTATEQAAVNSSNAAKTGQQKVAALTAGIASNGFDNGGSNATLINQTEDQSYLDQMTAVYTGQVSATGSNNSAALDSAQAGSAMTSAYLGAGTKLLGGIANIYKPTPQMSP